LEKKPMLSAALLAALPIVVAAPALAQGVPATVVDCVVGAPCVGSPRNDTITGSEGQDVIYALEGDDVIDPGDDVAPDYVSCGPGYDVVDQMPRVVPDDRRGMLQYDPGPDVIADDCEERAL
jgi:hypothetical protein